MNLPRLGVNIDHVATLRNARGENYPSPLRAALLCQDYGADGITAHLREDRRHIRDDDIYEIFDKRGLWSIYNEITSGEFIPFFPSRKIIERFEDLSKEGGVSNVYNQAESTLGQMEDQMYKLNLYQDYLLKN